MAWNDDELDIKTIIVVEQDTDKPMGNFSGLFNHKGQPLFTPKQPIGFRLGKVNGKNYKPY
jgi:hypothetical protein